jgi:hypothetical protein
VSLQRVSLVGLLGFAWQVLSAGATPGSPPCEVSGGGCVNKPVPPTHLQATFGGSTSTHSWEHIYRDGRTILFRFVSQDARLALCRPDPGSCRPPGVASRAELVGTGTFTTSTDSVATVANFDVGIFDRGSCDGDARDTYSITVRRGHVLGQGEVVYTLSGDLGCGNLRIDSP